MQIANSWVYSAVANPQIFINNPQIVQNTVLKVVFLKRFFNFVQI
jgi:hypothetical protein